MKKRLLACLLILSVLVVSCATTTTFTSSEPVDVYVNGEYIGKTPNASVRLSDAVWKDHQCYYVSEDGQQGACTIQKEVKVGAIIGGIFIWPIFLWSYGPKSGQFINTNWNTSRATTKFAQPQQQQFGQQQNYQQPQQNYQQPQQNYQQPQQNYQQPQQNYYQQPQNFQQQQQNIQQQPQGYIDNNGQVYYIDVNGEPYYLDPNGRPYYIDANGNPYYKQ